MFVIIFQNNSAFKMVYNDTAVHSIPITLNIISNTLLSMFANSSKLQISVQQWAASSKELPKFDGSLFGSVMLLGMSFAVVPAGFAMQIVYERAVCVFS